MGKMIKLTAALAFIVASLIGVRGTSFAQLKVTEPTMQSQAQQSTESDFDKRQQERKQRLKVALSEEQKNNLKSKCKAAQGNVSKIIQRAKGISTSRQQVYVNMQDSLTILSDRLEAKGVSVEALDNDIAKLKQAVATFNTDMETYMLAIGDLAEVDCQNDPEAFQAALLEARQTLATLKDDSAAIKAVLKDTIRPQLVTAAKSLKSQNNADNKDSGAGANSAKPKNESE